MAAGGKVFNFQKDIHIKDASNVEVFTTGASRVFKAITTATSTSVVSASAGKVIYVMGVHATVSGGNTIIFKDGTTAISGTKQVTLGAPLVYPVVNTPYSGWFKVASGKSLNVTTSTTGVTGIELVYYQV